MSAVVRRQDSELLSAAELLLSVSPMFKPQPQRDRSWSLQSLETLVDVATRSEFTLGPSAASQPAKKKVRKTIAPVKGRSLLQPDQSPYRKQPSKPILASAATKAAHHLTPSLPLHLTPQVDRMIAVKVEMPVCPSLLPAKYRSIYFRDGRVGIYTLQQRKQLIDKFAGKRQRRVWAKKVRYSCRKNLAKQRLRFKGRFVKTTEQLHARPEFDDEN